MPGHKWVLILVRGQSGFCHFNQMGVHVYIHFVYRNICYENPNLTKVVLKVFPNFKLKFECNKGSRKARTAQC